eukprot:1160149-Pelagomonas_calceolata.AAC.9
MSKWFDTASGNAHVYMVSECCLHCVEFLSVLVACWNTLFTLMYAGSSTQLSVTASAAASCKHLHF